MYAKNYYNLEKDLDDAMLETDAAILDVRPEVLRKLNRIIDGFNHGV